MDAHRPNDLVRRLTQALASVAPSSDSAGKHCWCRDRREMDLDETLVQGALLGHDSYCANAREVYSDAIATLVQSP